MEPVSHYFYSHRLKLQFWDWGSDGKPALVLVHGTRDHARSWDRVARALRENYHVYALDLRGHGNSAWAPGALYSLSEHILDLTVFLDIINAYPVNLMGHSLGAMVALHYAGVYPDRVKKLVVIEGLGVGPHARPQRPAPERMQRWIEKVRSLEHRAQRSYPNLAAAVVRMREANPFLSEQLAEHLTLHGTNWNGDGSLVWKFDNYTHSINPFGFDRQETADLLAAIDCPTLMFWGRQSFAIDPDEDAMAQLVRHRRVVKVDQAGHWVHHDQLDLFLRESEAFLAE
jgi:pimeloyl-ACP methyl ester carboxylesterase